MEFLTQFARARKRVLGCAAGAVLVVLPIALLVAMPAWPSGESVADEYELKAAVLYNVSKFVEWPAWKMQTPRDPFVIGIVGPAALVRDMERSFHDKSVWGKRIVVRRTRSVAEEEQCHLVFVAEEEDRPLSVDDPALAKAAVLTAGEGTQFARIGGVIGLVLKDSRIQMEVNLEAARRSGINISSRLLRLVTLVEGP